MTTILQGLQEACVRLAEDTVEDPHYLNSEEFRSFVVAVTSSAWWRSRSTGRSVIVKFRTSTSDLWAYTDGWSEMVVDPKGPMSKLMALHELAHVLQGDAPNDHGWSFQRAYTTLLRRYAPSWKLEEKLR